MFLVDDSKTVRDIVKGVLHTVGITAVEEAGDGQDALSRMDGITFVKT